MTQAYSENGVVDKTRNPVSSTIWSISTYAVSVWRHEPNWLVAGIPILSTTRKSLTRLSNNIEKMAVRLPKTSHS